MASPVVPSNFESVIPNSNSSLCGSFVDALLKLPVLVARFVTWMLGEDGEFTEEFIKAISNASVQTGMIVPAAAIISDPNWILCNGASKLRADYPALFNKIGTVYGVGSDTVGATTFNVPDMRDMMPIGAGTTYAVGATGGSLEVTLTEAMLPPHKHYFTVADNTGLEVSSEEGRLVGTGGWITGANTKAGTTRDYGSGTPETQLAVTLPRPPLLALYYFIRA